MKKILVLAIAFTAILFVSCNQPVAKKVVPADTTKVNTAKVDTVKLDTVKVAPVKK